MTSKLKSRRLQLELTQDECAKEVGVTKQTLCYWENDPSALKQVRQFSRLAKKLGDSIENLI